ncbi:MAG: dienelactone hydrolase family protein [Woeseia sp.]|nr:dienelactone hydrolase family protein [Woeseia sp.]NNE59496.1 dienelactone hydrolase family protein [Woeseia sp.]
MLESFSRRLLACSACLWVCLLAACGGTDDPGRENVDAMTREHAGDNGRPSAAGDTAPLTDVIGETLPYAEVDNHLVYGYFVFPIDMVEPLPAVIMIHEWWGLNDGLRAMADRLAGEGYIVLAVDLFQGQTAENPDGARRLMLEVLENQNFAEENIQQAYDFLLNTANAPSVASLGWCFGGGWSLNTALMFPDSLSAAVMYYGQVTSDEEQLQDLNVPILGIFAEQDRGIPVSSVEDFEGALQRLRKNFTIRIYPEVGHAFANPSGNSYNAAAAADAWQLTLDFLAQHLRSPAPST